jgi:FtsX-like permease family
MHSTRSSCSRRSGHRAGRSGRGDSYPRRPAPDQGSGQRDFEAQSLGSRLETVNHLLHILTLFTASIAAISLVVGDIGVLNIMLVSVTERTREIGIRKALGTTRRAILQQFLVESTMLGSIGGLIGVALGIGLSALSAALAPHGTHFQRLRAGCQYPFRDHLVLGQPRVGLIAGATRPTALPGYDPLSSAIRVTRAHCSADCQNRETTERARLEYPAVLQSNSTSAQRPGRGIPQPGNVF